MLFPNTNLPAVDRLPLFAASAPTTTQYHETIVDTTIAPSAVCCGKSLLLLHYELPYTKANYYHDWLVLQGLFVLAPRVVRLFKAEFPSNRQPAGFRG
jgi:hypothetical protein